MTGPQSPKYKAEPADQLLVEPLDAMTLIYQRRSGITHIVAEPVPEILAVMGGDALGRGGGCCSGWRRNSILMPRNAVLEIVASRLEELAALGLVERVRA